MDAQTHAQLMVMQDQINVLSARLAQLERAEQLNPNGVEVIPGSWAFPNGVGIDQIDRSVAGSEVLTIAHGLPAVGSDVGRAIDGAFLSPSGRTSSNGPNIIGFLQDQLYRIDIKPGWTVSGIASRGSVLGHLTGPNVWVQNTTITIDGGTNYLDINARAYWYLGVIFRSTDYLPTTLKLEWKDSTGTWNTLYDITVGGAKCQFWAVLTPPSPYQVRGLRYTFGSPQGTSVNLDHLLAINVNAWGKEWLGIEGGSLRGALSVSGDLSVADGYRAYVGPNDDVDIGSYGIMRNYLSKWPGPTIKDHFLTATINPYWTGWTTTPGVVNYQYRGHFLYAGPTGAQQNTQCFLYKSETVPTGKTLATWVGIDSNNCKAGIRLDDGGSHYLELYIHSGLTMPADAQIECDADGITGVLVPVFPGGKAFNLSVLRVSATQFYLYVSDDVPSGFTYAANFVTGWTPTRHGIFVTNGTASGTRHALFHWYGSTI